MDARLLPMLLVLSASVCGYAAEANVLTAVFSFSCGQKTDNGYAVPDSAGGYDYYYYVKDWQGNVRAVIDEANRRMELNNYYPYGMPMSSTASVQPYKYGGKELDRTNGLDMYDFHARHYDPIVPHFITMDELCEKYPSYSPYIYCLGNPINAIDPTGRSTWVLPNGNGMYQVVGGDINDNDLNIYLAKEKSNGGYMKGDVSIGMTTTITSFYNSDESKWIGATIDPNDSSGKDFLGDIINSPPTLVDYMLNARTGHRYDFKATNGTEKELFKGAETYRGMPVGNMCGQTIYTSARDIGNMVAGYIAGINGISYIEARLAFDAYETLEHGFGIEGISTRNAEFYGWKIGYSQPLLYKAYQRFRSQYSSPTDLFINLWKK